MSSYVIIFGLLSVLLPVAWLVSEFKGSRTLRIALGVFALVGIGFITHLLSMVTPNYERYFYGASFLQMEGLLSNGDTNTVIRGVRVHNAVARTGTVYQAAHTFMSALGEENRETHQVR